MTGKIRLDKGVAHGYGLSRSAAASVIRDGLVTVGGEVCTDPAVRIPGDALICYGECSTTPTDTFKKRAFMLNKPPGLVCANTDGNHPTVLGLFRNETRTEALHCAGRLDANTTGLLVVTDDGSLIHRITSPRKHISKVYLARTDRDIPQDAIQAFATGLHHPMERRRYRPVQLEIVEDRLAKVTLSEGRYHEVRRLFECVGLRVRSLTRIQIGSLALDEGLGSGEYRPLSEGEIELIFKA